MFRCRGNPLWLPLVILAGTGTRPYSIASALDGTLESAAEQRREAAPSNQADSEVLSPSTLLGAP
jgi:hypothetical protein